MATLARTPISLAVVLFPWEPKPGSGSQEIPIVKDQVITVYQKFENGWWVGQVNGTNTIGIFPGTYVKEVQMLGGSTKGAPTTTTTATAPATAALQSSTLQKSTDPPLQRSTTDPAKQRVQSTNTTTAQIAPFTPVSTSTITTPTSADTRERVIAITSQVGSGPHLAFQEGDEIIVLEKWQTGWCRGQCNGKVGLFASAHVTTPATYKKRTNSSNVQINESAKGSTMQSASAIKLVTANTSAAANTTTTASSTGSQPDRPPTLFLARAIFEFKGQEETELTFPQGALVEVLKILEEGGWWQGEYDGKLGHFPGNYVEKVKVKALYDYTGLSASELTFHAGDLITVIDRVPTGSWRLGEMDGKQGHFPINYVEEVPPTVTVATASYPKAEVLYDYEDKGVTELVLKKGDILVILEKLQDGGWWKGELGGVIGHFPASYVKELPEEEIKQAQPPSTKNADASKADEARLRQEKEEAEKRELEEARKKEKEEKARLEQEHAEREKVARDKERLERERAEKDKQEKEQEKQEKEKPEKEKHEKEKHEKERHEKDRHEKKKHHREKAKEETDRKKDRSEREREKPDKESRAEKEKAKQEKQEKEKAEREKTEKEEQEKVEKAEREKAEKEKVERERRHKPVREKSGRSKAGREKAADKEREKADKEKEKAADKEREKAADKEREKAADKEREKAADKEREKAADKEREKAADKEREKAADKEREKAADKEREKAADKEREKAADKEREKAADKEREKAADKEREKAADKEREKDKTDHDKAESEKEAERMKKLRADKERIERERAEREKLSKEKEERERQERKERAEKLLEQEREKEKLSADGQERMASLDWKSTTSSGSQRAVPLKVNLRAGQPLPKPPIKNKPDGDMPSPTPSPRSVVGLTSGSVPQVLPKAIAVAAHEATNSSELSFEKDDVIIVEVQMPGDMWKGSMGGVRGLFPKSCVKLLAPSPLSGQLLGVQNVEALDGDAMAMLRFLQLQVADLTKKAGVVVGGDGERGEEGRVDRLERELRELRDKFDSELRHKAKLERENKRLEEEVEVLRRGLDGKLTPRRNLGASNTEEASGEDDEHLPLSDKVRRLDDALQTESRARRDLEALHNKVEGELGKMTREFTKLKRWFGEQQNKPAFVEKSLKKTGRDLSV